MKKYEKRDGDEPVIVTVALADGLVYEDNFSPDTTFGEIATKAAETMKVGAHLVLEFADGDHEFPAAQTLQSAGFDKTAKLHAKAALVNVIVITGGANFHAHLPPDTTLAKLAALVVEECGLIIGDGEAWSIKHPGDVTGIDPNLTLASAGFKRSAKLEYSKDQYQGG